MPTNNGSTGQTILAQILRLRDEYHALARQEHDRFWWLLALQEQINISRDLVVLSQTAWDRRFAPLGWQQRDVPAWVKISAHLDDEEHMCILKGHNWFSEQGHL